MSATMCPTCGNQVDTSNRVCPYCGSPIKVSKKDLIKTIRLIVIVVGLIISALFTIYQMVKPYLPEPLQFGSSEQNNQPTESATPEPTPEDTTPIDAEETESPIVVDDSKAIELVDELMAAGICSKLNTAEELLGSSEFPQINQNDWDNGFVRQCQTAASKTTVTHWVTIFGPELSATYGEVFGVPVNTILINGDDWVIRSNYYGGSNPKTSNDETIKAILSKFGGTYVLP